MRKLFRYLHNPILPHLPLETRERERERSFLLFGWLTTLTFSLNISGNKKVSAKAISSSNTYCSSHPWIECNSPQRQQQKKQKKKKGETFSSLEVCYHRCCVRGHLEASSKQSLSLDGAVCIKNYQKILLQQILIVSTL